MKYIFILYSLILALFFLSCHNKDSSDTILNFKIIEKKTLLPLDYNNKTLLLGFPSVMATVDSAIIILNTNGSKLITILDLKDKKIIKMGNRGKGPGELISPGGIASNNSNKKCFEIYDSAKKLLLIYNIDSCRLSLGKSKPIKEYEIDNLTFGCFSLTDSTLLGIGLFANQHSLMVSNTQKKPLVQFGDCNYNPKDRNSAINKLLAYQGVYRVQDSNFVWACSYANVIDIYTIRNKNEAIRKNRIINSFADYAPQNNQRGSSSAIKPRNEFCYLDVATTSNSIYLLYSGKATINTKNIYDTVKCTEIQVFDWMGNPIKKIILNKEVVNIAVSESTKTMYGIIHNPEPQIVYFQL